MIQYKKGWFNHPGSHQNSFILCPHCLKENKEALIYEEVNPNTDVIKCSNCNKVFICHIKKSIFKNGGFKSYTNKLCSNNNHNFKEQSFLDKGVCLTYKVCLDCRFMINIEKGDLNK